jgi:hypothetical protein
MLPPRPMNAVHTNLSAKQLYTELAHHKAKNIFDRSEQT